MHRLDASDVPVSAVALRVIAAHREGAPVLRAAPYLNE
jgi:hypothetical protein